MTTTLLTKDFDYPLPSELIAQVPLEPRHSSRLLVLNRSTGIIEHRAFWDIDEYLNPGDLLVMNETRVLRARLYGVKLPGGGKIELLLLKKRDNEEWEVLVGGSGMQVGRIFKVNDGPSGMVTEALNGSERLIRFDESIEPYLETIGRVPLPPYIHTQLDDPERYQTVYAHKPGSAAAPTAGLHFTPQLLQKISTKGIDTAFVNLRVGLDTFAPVTEERADEHVIHKEWCSLPLETVDLIKKVKARGNRVIAVGTTSVRTLETAARHIISIDQLQPYEGDTALYILPGYEFKLVDCMITNFHLPKSTLLMLVSAFAGQETILHAYQEAIRLKYRFFSFGDAMLIV